ncbi:hypothetical protein BASA81_000628 [Batrachochytrium salamandrivorans]|nr:hypothetical protein BASA81_000628 [Batrachochytrium salamandrivorans]
MTSSPPTKAPPVVRTHEVEFLGPLLIALGAVLLLFVGVVSLRVWKQRKVRPRGETTGSRPVSEKSSHSTRQRTTVRCPDPITEITLDADPCTNEAEKIESGVYLHHARV